MSENNNTSIMEHQEIIHNYDKNNDDNNKFVIEKALIGLYVLGILIVLFSFAGLVYHTIELFDEEEEMRYHIFNIIIALANMVFVYLLVRKRDKIAYIVYTVMVFLVALLALVFFERVVLIFYLILGVYLILIKKYFMHKDEENVQKSENTNE